MKKDLLKFSFIWRFAVSLLTCTGLVIFLIWNRILFFGESQATDQYAMQIEPYRPVFYNCMLILTLVTYLVGVVIAYRRTVTDKTHTEKNVKMPRSVLVVGAAVFVVFNACISYGIIELINNPWLMMLKSIHIYLGIGIRYADAYNMKEKLIDYTKTVQDDNDFEAIANWHIKAAKLEKKA